MTTLVKFKFFLYLFIIIFLPKLSFANDCLSKQDIKVGLFENRYIDYKYYLYYMLGEYTFENEINFEISKVNNNADEFDIIFGEYRDLEKLSYNQTEVPKKVLEFYQKNEIEIIGNIFPLDLDTFIILSQQNGEKLNFEDLSQLYSPLKYTLGISLQTKEDIINLLIYILDRPNIDLNSMTFELIVELFNKTYENMNKNIIDANYMEFFNSYENSENIYTLFSDGILLNKNISYESFQLFPKSKYIWNEDQGVFKESYEDIPISFYGFSAYLNNSQNSGFLCYLTNEKVRLKTFKDFNIQLSPLSIHELEKIEDELPQNYKEILTLKNKNIIKPNYLSNYKNYDLFLDMFLDNKSYGNIFDNQNYLN